MNQTPDEAPKPAATEPSEASLQAQLTEIAALLSLTAEQYQQQARITRQTAQAEMTLSGHSLLLALVSLVALGAGIVMLWGSLLALAGYLLLQATSSLPLTAALLFVLQLAALYWCWCNVHYLLKQVGFRHTMAQLKHTFRFAAAPTGGDNAHRATD